MRYDAIVIGAGPNGLTAAAALAKRGRTVLVLERAPTIGGHTRAIEFAPGFRAPLNADAGWVPPNVAKVIGERSAHDRTTAVRTYEPPGGDTQRWTQLVTRLHKFAGVLGALYQLAPPDIDTTSPTELLPLLGVALRTKALGRADMNEFLRVMPMSIQDLVDDTFEREEPKVEMAAAAIRDLRQGPRSAGTTFNLIHNMIGAPEGFVTRAAWKHEGPDALATAAEKAARVAGADISLDTGVARISVRDNAVTGVVLENGDEFTSATVLSTADPKRTLLGLLDPVWLDPEFMHAVKNIKLRGSTAYVMYGVDTEVEPHGFPRSVTASTVALEKAADAAKYGEVSAEPHVEFFSPSARWPYLAPAGKHVVVARLQYAPYSLKRGAWNAAQAAEIGDKATCAINRVVPGFESSIVHRAVLTPRDIEETFGVTEGALTQGEMMLDQILFMRPVPGWARYEMPVRGLFLAGSGAHPGPGVLGGAGLLAAKAALKKL